MKNRYFFLSVYLLVLTAVGASAQDDPRVASIKERFSLYANRAVQEKLYLHIDRPFYLVGESIWFRAYNLSGADNSFIGMSKVGYVEVLDKENNPVIQTKFSMLSGKGNGAMMIPSALASGTYKVRCYTNWMKNFGPEHYFESLVSIVNPFVRFDPNPEEKKSANFDATFFPEGGYLVKGIESKVAFRVIGTDGNGIDFNGAIVGPSNDTLVRFKPNRYGIGNFIFQPTEASYKAVVRDATGKTQVFPLPEIRQEGYAMQVEDISDKFLKITVSSNGEVSPSIYLFTHTRQNNVRVFSHTLINGKSIFNLEKSALNEGISHFTILNEKQKPLCERLYFKRPEKHLAIQVSTGKPNFGVREKVTLDLTASAKGNVPASLSVAVYLEDSIKGQRHQDIESWVWLSSDLAGTVEAPDFYFRKSGGASEADFDNLMLTHGWRRFKWNEVFENKLNPYPNLLEYDGHFVFGRALNATTGAPAPYIETYFAGLDYPARLFTSVSDPNGNLRFELKDFYGPKEVAVQNDFTKDSTVRFEIFSPFEKHFTTRTSGRFFFDKSLEEKLLTRTLNMQTQNAFTPKSFTNPKVVLSDSTAFFGPPDEKYFLDDYTRFPTMEEVLREYVRGVIVKKQKKEFIFRMVDKLVPNAFYQTNPLVLLDGIPVFNVDKVMELDPLKVKKVEVMNARYFLGAITFNGIASFTTYQNDLAGYELSSKVLVTPYEGIQAPREFYQPKYDSKQALESRLPDFRNLLFWAPDVTTDASGKTQVSFYTSDQSGRYRVVVQGMTPTGAAGSQSIILDVAKTNL